MLKENASFQEMLKNVEHSTLNAHMALQQMENNLIKGRFKEGLKAYEVMCDTLIGQKIWASDKNNTKIDENFVSIAETSKRIIDILQPYVENLQRLTEMGESIVVTGAEQTIKTKGSTSLSSEEKQILLVLSSSSKNQISQTKLRSTLGWEKNKFEKYLLLLEAKALTRRKIISSRQMVIKL